MDARRAAWLVADGGRESQLAGEVHAESLGGDAPARRAEQAGAPAELAAVHGVALAVVSGAVLWMGAAALVRWLIG